MPVRTVGNVWRKPPNGSGKLPEDQFLNRRTLVSLHRTIGDDPSLIPQQGNSGAHAAKVQVQLGPPSRTAFPLEETRSCHHSVTHFVPNTCPMIVSKTYG